MLSRRLNVVKWLLLVISVQYGQCCGPAEIGHKYTIVSPARFSSDYYDYSSSVIWQLGSTSVTLYDSSEVISNLFPNIYSATRTQISILNVTKKDGTGYFQHVVGGSVVYTCTLPVYKRASPPTCEAVKITGRQIRTMCTTAQVFPSAKCQFTIQNDGTDSRVIASGSYITYNNTEIQLERNENYGWQQEYIEYYSTSCTLQYPVDGLKPGNWTVQVNMYPNQTGVSLAQGTKGQAANTLHLSVPTVNIDPNNCPKGLAGEGNTNVRQGYIRQGGRASCLCTRAYVGNPPGTIGWSSTQGGNFNMLLQSEKAGTIQINSPDNFTCQSISVLDGSHSATYRPKYAYGPSSASLTSQRPGPIYLCPKQQTNMDITCQVPVNTFNPAILFTIRHNNNNNLITKVAGGTENYNFTKSGQHTFTCRVENAIFSDMFSEAPASTIQVYAPPNSPPTFQVTGQYVNTDNSETWVKRGSDITVSCLAGDGYPQSNLVTVNCGQKTSSSGQLSVSGVSRDELKCQCAVDHVTRTPCNGLNLTNEITIKTAYGPNEVAVSFADNQLKEVLNEPLNLCGSEALDLSVICAVKPSDVRPGLTTDDFTWTKSKAFTFQQQYLDTLVGGDYRSVNKLKIISGGNHSLACEARNPKFSDINQTQAVTIEVREPPRDPPKIYARSSQNGDILVDGDDVIVTCEVSGGYPSVQSVTLTCGQGQSATSNGTSAELTLNNIGLSYNETNCTCEATHITGCYDVNGVLSLIIVMSNQTRREISSDITKAQLAGVVVGSLVGILVLVAVIVLMVFYIRGKKAQRKSRDTEYNPIERPHYQNVRPDDQNYLGIVTSNKGPGVARENVNKKTENIDLNGIEPVEHDDHVYNEINDREESTKQDTEANSRKDQTEPTEPNPYTEILD